MPCPDEDVITGFVRGTLSGPQRTEIEEHLDDCPACSQVVADLVRIFGRDGRGVSRGLGAQHSTADEGMASTEATVTVRSGAGADDSEAVVLRAGAVVGRYQVLECIGFGAMGVVYGAYDPQLDRKVALKVLRAAGGEESEKEERDARLLREAQLMARLSHPNVITVHDVGYYEDRVFLAMEFVQGTTMARWLRHPRRWKEIRDVFVAAGQGLAAAHAAGLVHRDFKPDNVLIGDDGRVRVTDFGLARYRAPSESQVETDQQTDPQSDRGGGAPKPAKPRPVVPTLTRTGALIGTPAYMAPEQYDLAEVSAATDQFAFCVALYEAITGQRPFPGRTVAELANHVTAGTVRPIKDARAPARVVRAVRRGLSVDPEERFEDMHALLSILNRRPSHLLRRWGVVTVPTLLLGLGLWSSQNSAPPKQGASGFCAADSGFDRVWNRDRRDRVYQAFEGTDLVYASTTARRVSAELDAYAVTWERARERVCDGEAAGTEPQRAGARLCLREHWSAAEALLEIFASADEHVVPKAVAAVEGLGDPGACLHVSTAAAPPADPEVREEVEALQQELARAGAMREAGRLQEALDAVSEVERQATRLESRPLVAQARLARARTHSALGQYEVAEAELREAAWLGVEARDRRGTANAWADLAFLRAARLDDPEGAREAMRAARAELEAFEDPALERRLQSYEATLAFMEGRYEDALRGYQAQLEGVATDDPRRAAAMANLAGVHSRLGHLEEALAGYKETAALVEKRLGGDHPIVANAYYNIGVTLLELDRLDEAMEALRNADALQSRTLPSEHPQRGMVLGLMGYIWVLTEQFEEAEPRLRQAYEIARQSVPSDAKYLPHANLVSALISMGRFEDARVELEAMDRSLTQDGDPVDERVTWMLLMARLHREQGNSERALALASEAKETLDGCQACEDAMASNVHAELGEALLAAGRSAEAVEHLQAALKEDLPAQVEAETGHSLARALWAAGRHDEARSAGRQAMQRARPGSVSAHELRAWLEQHA